MKSGSFLFLNEVSYEKMAEGVYRQVLGYDDNLMQVRVKFEQGSVASDHSHLHSQTSYIVSGSFEFKVGDEIRLVKAGDGVYIAPNVVHGVKCLEAGVVLDSFSPVRADFLP